MAPRIIKNLSKISAYQKFQVLYVDAVSQLFLLLCTHAFGSVPKDTKQQKRGVVGNDGWIGLLSPYGHGQPWSLDHTPWKGLKFPAVNLHAG